MSSTLDRVKAREFATTVVNALVASYLASLPKEVNKKESLDKLAAFILPAAIEVFEKGNVDVKPFLKNAKYVDNIVGLSLWTRRRILSATWKKCAEVIDQASMVRSG